MKSRWKLCRARSSTDQATERLVASRERDGAPAYSGRPEETGKTRRAGVANAVEGGNRREGLREDVGGEGDCGVGVRFQRALRSESDERFRNMVGGFKPLARGVGDMVRAFHVQLAGAVALRILW